MDRRPNHNTLCAQLAQAAGATAESSRRGATICNIAIGELFTHVAICKQGAAGDTTCLELGTQCIRLDMSGKVVALSEGAETFLDAVAKSIKLSDVLTADQVHLIGALVAETIINVVCRRRPPQVSQRLLCTEPLAQFHTIDEYWLGGLPRLSDLSCLDFAWWLRQGLEAALSDRGLKYRIAGL